MSYSAAHEPTNPDATPLYNDNILKFWNWFDSVWGCSDWITWHKAVKAKYGKEQADTVFLTHWEDLATASSAIDCRSFNTAFRDYMQKEKLLDALYSGIGIIAKPLGVGTDIVTSVGGGISNLGKTTENVTKVLKIAIPVMLVVAIGFAGVWGYKHFVKPK